MRDVSVYARVAPEHKLRIVDALQADGNIVAMTGDGVNDAPALKAADIGVAMGITGTDVTKEAADMILADDNFATIVAAVREGRAIFANIRKFLRFLLSSNIGEVLTMFFGVVLAGVIGLDDTGEAVAVPLLATQILWINLLTDTAPALAMGVDPPPDDVMRRPPRRLTDRVIDARDVVRHRLGRPRHGGGDAGGARPAACPAACSAARATSSRPARWRSRRSCSPSSSTASTPARTARARSTTCSRTALLWGAIALSVVLQVAVVQVPFLNDAVRHDAARGRATG